MKIFSRIGYYIKEGVSSIFTHGFMSFASICVIVACLLIMGSFTLLALNVQRIIGEFEEKTTKTEKGEREIPLTNTAMQILIEQKLDL